MSHLPKDFSIRRFRFYENKNCFYLPMRELDFIDVTICLEGSMVYYINDERIELSRSDALVIPVGYKRTRYRSVTPACYASFSVVVPSDWSGQIQGVIRNCVDSSVSYLLHLFAEDWRADHAKNQDKCKALFTYIYYKLEDAFIVHENKHVSAAKKYISKNLFSPLSLSCIAAELSITPQHLSTLFKKHTDQTVVDYVNSERISAAEAKILNDSSSLCDIAEACGFTNYHYFTHLFKRVTGHSPSSYRKAFAMKSKK